MENNWDNFMNFLKLGNASVVHKNMNLKGKEDSRLRQEEIKGKINSASYLETGRIESEDNLNKDKTVSPAIKMSVINRLFNGGRYLYDIIYDDGDIETSVDRLKLKQNPKQIDQIYSILNKYTDSNISSSDQTSPSLSTIKYVYKQSRLLQLGEEVDAKCEHHKGQVLRGKVIKVGGVIDNPSNPEETSLKENVYLIRFEDGVEEEIDRKFMYATFVKQELQS